MLESDAPELGLNDIRQPLTTAIRPRPFGPLVGAVVLVSVLIVGFGIGLLQGPSPSTTVEAGAPPLLSSIALGEGHLWPEKPSELSEADLAVAFARDVLGWESAAGQLMQGEVSEAGTWVRVQRNIPVEEELLDVLVAPVPEGGNVVMQVGTPWARGMDLTGEAGGLQTSLLRISGGLRAEALLRLESGDYLSGFAPVTVGGDPAISFPGVDFEAVSSGLVRYLTEDGSVHAAVGDVFSQSPASEPNPACAVTVPDVNVAGPLVNGDPLPAPEGMAWIGGSQLATFLPANGAVWENLPAKGEFRTQKLFVWAEGYDWVAEPEPNLSVVASPSDPTQPNAVTSVSNGSRSDWGSFMVVGVDLVPGCWSIELEYNGDALDFMVRVSE